MAHRVSELAAYRGWSAFMETRNSKSKKRNDMRVFVATVMVAFSLFAWGCGGSTYSSGNPVTPTPTPAPTPTPTPASGTVTINVVGINGAQSFAPNPATLPAGQMVVWHNIDSVVHRVILNNGSPDTGDFAPGASKSADVHQHRQRTVPLFDSSVDGRHHRAGCVDLPVA
jgi:plastocyanin